MWPFLSEIAANSSLAEPWRVRAKAICQAGKPCVSRLPSCPTRSTSCKTRRSVKPIEMTGPAPSSAEIDTLLTVASRVPDHGKLTPWRFIVFEGDARLADRRERSRRFSARTIRRRPPTRSNSRRTRLARAPLVIAVVSRAAPHVKIPEWEQLMSAGAAAMNLVTAAHAQGYRRELAHRMVRL